LAHTFPCLCFAHEPKVKVMIIFSLFTKLPYFISNDAFPSSLINSNVSLKWKQQENKELGHTPWLVTFWG
jgi:hypothetical protein